MANGTNELDGIQPRWTLPWPLRMLLAGACLVIIIAGLKVVAPILSGFLFAMLLALVLTPVVRKLMRWRVPKPLAILITMFGVFIGAALLIYLVIGSVSELSGNLPEYNQRYLTLREQLFGFLQGYGVDTSKLLNVELLEPDKLVKPAASVIGRVLADLGHTFFILLITTFLLIEFTSVFAGKEIAHTDGERTSLVRFRELGADVQKYVGISAVMGLIGAACYFVLLKVMGMPYVATWVVLFFVLSFVPTIGGPLAVVPVLLLMVLTQGIQRTIIFAVIFILFNSFLGDIIKPRIMQKGFEIGIVSIFFALVFWNYVLGPVGIVLAIPLTITIRRLIQEYAPDVRQALVE